MNRSLGNPADNRQCGAAMVEFAVLLPVLVILVFGFTEIARAVMQTNTLTKAVTVGARYVARIPDAVDTSSCSAGTAWGAATTEAELLVENETAGTGTVILPGLDAGGAIIFSVGSETSGSGAGLVNACVITVTAQAQFAALFGDSIVPLLNLGPINLNAQAEERYIGT
jgi:Flp pilus assembly protein TadG